MAKKDDNGKVDVNRLMELLAATAFDVREGDYSPAKANAISNATGKIFSAVKIQMEYGKMLGIVPDIPAIRIKRYKKIEAEEKKIPAGK